MYYILFCILFYILFYWIVYILLFFSVSLHWSLRKAFLSLLAILWNSAFKYDTYVIGCGGRCYLNLEKSAMIFKTTIECPITLNLYFVMHFFIPWKIQCTTDLHGRTWCICHISKSCVFWSHVLACNDPMSDILECDTGETGSQITFELNKLKSTAPDFVMLRLHSVLIC